MILIKEVEFKEIEAGWRNLEAEGHVPTVFQTFDWMECWWKHLGHRGKALLVGIYDGDEIIGIAPLYRYTMRVKGIPIFRMLGVMGAGESDYNAFVLKKNRELDVCLVLLDYLKKIKWDIFWLTDVHPETQTAKFFGSFLKEKKFHFFIKSHTPCPYIELPASYEEYKKGLSKHVRQNTANICNKVMKLPGIEIRKIVDKNEIGSAINDFIHLHQDRWNKVQQSGALSNLAVQKFHFEVATRLARYLDLKQLCINGKVIATTYSYNFNGRRLFYLPGMDLDYKQYRLGTAMIVFGIQDAISNGLREFDFLRGDEEYKFHFTKTVRTNLAFYFSKSNLKFLLFKFFERL
jgi:CelD/BcsL family acetyltransferase involved in cellulose biosynthesis